MHAQTFFSFLLVGGAGAFLWHEERFSTFIDAMAKIASRKEYVLLCFSLSVLIKKLQSDSMAVALAVELDAATRFILSYLNCLHTHTVCVDKCSYSQGRASPDMQS